MIMDVREQVTRIVAECMEIDPDTIDRDMDLFDMLGFDSMRAVMILAKIEDTFDIMIPEDDLFDITSINAWVREIEKLK